VRIVVTVKEVLVSKMAKPPKEMIGTSHGEVWTAIYVHFIRNGPIHLRL